MRYSALVLSSVLALDMTAAHAACDGTCQASFVTEHNRVRTRVNSGQMPAPAGFQPIPGPPLGAVVANAAVATGAQAWADGCNYAHSTGTGLGENLYASAGFTPTPANVVAAWEDESTAYTYAAIGNPINNFAAIGHYTQLVWANTTAVGCGIAHCTTNSPFGAGFLEWDFAVCRYSPAGNITGQVPYSVAPPSADLSVTQTPSPNPAGTGKDLVYALTVANAGPGTATSVTLTDTLPAGPAFIWASPGCTNAAGTVTCNLGTLASGANTQVKVVIRPSAAGAVANTANVASAVTDPNGANNASASNVTVNATPAGTPILRYRLYSPVTLEHHFTTDLNEYNVLGTFVGTWVQEGTVGKVLNNPGAFNGVTATPYYRLYNATTRWHHWTTDANEYYTLVLFPGWNGEGVDGYILPTQAAGSIQLFRLLYPPIGGLHHWTIDTNEYNTLIATYGWIGEGGSGFVIP